MIVSTQEPKLKESNMKKISILLVVFGIFLSYSFLFAAETGASESGYYELVIMLDNSKTISDSQVMLIREIGRAHV